MWRQMANGAATAAASGGATAATALVLDPNHFDWEKTTLVFAAGAAIGLLNWIRQSPWNKHDQQGQERT